MTRGMESATLVQDEHDHDDLAELFFVSLTDDETGNGQSLGGPYRDSRPIL